MGLEIYYNTGDDAIGGNSFGVNWKGQTFTTVGAFDITKVSLKLARTGSPGNLTVSIRATDGGGLPTGADLVAKTQSGNAITTDSGGEWVDFTFASAYGLSATTKYAIVLAAPDAGGAPDLIGWRGDTTSPTYADGSVMVSSDSGVNWTAATTDDWMFETYSADVTTTSSSSTSSSTTSSTSTSTTSTSTSSTTTSSTSSSTTSSTSTSSTSTTSTSTSSTSTSSTTTSSTTTSSTTSSTSTTTSTTSSSTTTSSTTTSSSTSTSTTSTSTSTSTTTSSSSSTTTLPPYPSDTIPEMDIRPIQPILSIVE